MDRLHIVSIFAALGGIYWMLFSVQGSIGEIRVEIADVRTEFSRDISQETHSLRTALSQDAARQIDGLRTELSQDVARQFDGLRTELSQDAARQFDGLRTELSQDTARQIDGLRTELLREVSDLSGQLSRVETQIESTQRVIVYAGTPEEVLEFLRALEAPDQER